MSLDPSHLLLEDLLTMPALPICRNRCSGWMFFCARLAFSGSAVSLEQLLLNIRRALFSPSRRAIVLFHSVTHLPANPSTACGHRMAHRKWKENKLQPGTAGPSNMLGCSLISFHFRWAILCPQAVTFSLNIGGKGCVKPPQAASVF